MRETATILLILFSLTIFATEQTPDVLIYKSDTICLETYPFEILMDSDSLIQQKIFGDKDVNEFFKEIYNTIKRIDKNHPVTGANMIYLKTGGDMGFDFLDVIGCNSYIGIDYSKNAFENANFSKSHARKRLSTMRVIMRKFKKPLLITEVGCPTLVKYNKQGEVIEEQIKLIGEKLAGFCIFEWTDEWWKGGGSKKQDFHVEDHWGILDAYRKPKPAYDVIKKYFNSIPTKSKGFNPDLF